MTWQGEKSDPLGIVQEIEIWPYYQILHAQSSICPGRWNADISHGFYDGNRSTIPGQITGHNDNNEKKKRKGKRDKYLGLTGALRYLWKTRVTVITIRIVTLGTVLDSLKRILEEFEIRGEIKTMQTTILLTAKTLRSVLEIYEENIIQIAVKYHQQLLVVKLKESEKKDKYLDLARGLRKTVEQDSKTRRLHENEQRKTDYINQKQYKQNKHQ